MPDAKSEAVGGTGIFIGAHNEICLYMIDQQTFVISAPDSVRAYLSRARASSGPMLMARERARKHHLTVAVNVAALPPEATRQIPPPLQPLAKASLAGLTIDVGTEASIEAGLRYADSESAIAAEKAARDGIAMIRQKLQEAKKQIGKPLLEPTTPAPAPLRELPEALASLGGLATFGVYDEILEKFPLSREDSNLVVRAKLPAHGAPTLPLAAVSIAAYFGFATRSKAGGPIGVISRPFEGRDAQTMNNMKQIGLAMHNYLSAYNQFPGHAIYSKDGKTPLLSWRVALLPFLEQEQLYKQFKLDEPWNSNHNKKLIAMMPPTYLSPHAPPPNEPGMTAFKIFAGGGAAWTRDVRGPRVPEITDGFSNTIMVTELADAVTWTKPEDVVYDPKKPLPKLGADPNSDSVLFLMMDGSVHKKPKSIPEASLRAAITRAGGEVLDWYDKRPTAPVLLVPSPPRPPDRP